MKRKKKKNKRESDERRKSKRHQHLHNPLHSLMHERQIIPDLHPPRNGISNPRLRQPQKMIPTHSGRTISPSAPHMQQHPRPRFILNPPMRLHIRPAAPRRHRPSVAPIRAKTLTRLFSKPSFPSTTLSRIHPLLSWFLVWAP